MSYEIWHMSAAISVYCRPAARRLARLPRVRPWRRIAAAVDRTSACTHPSRSGSSGLEIGTLRWTSDHPPAFHKQDQCALPFGFLLELKSLTRLQARQAKLLDYSSRQSFPWRHGLTVLG